MTLSAPARAVIALAFGVLVVGWFYSLLDVRQLDPFRLQYIGMNFPTGGELIFESYFLVLGTVAMALFTYAWIRTPVPGWVERFGPRLLASRWSVPVLVLLALAGMLLARYAVIAETALTQDEYTYDFIAETLSRGRLVNPLPADAEHFDNEFVLMTERGWWGKYPIGHPLLLALGSLVGLRFLVVPLVSVALLGATAWLGRRIMGHREALVAAFLMAVSPQLLLTGASHLSQPASALAATLGLIGLVATGESRRAGPALMAGAGFGYAILVRPLPGVVYVPVAGLWLLWRLAGAPWRRRVGLCVLLGVGVVAGVGTFLAVNTVQTGDPLTTGYHLDYDQSGLEVLHPDAGSALLASSVVSNLTRFHRWQAGFPLLLLFAFLARRDRHTLLLVGMIGAQLGYRLLVPKAGVMCTGPVYVYEILPWVSLLVADGLVRFHRGIGPLRPERARAWTVPVVLAGLLVAATIFWPVQVRSLRHGTSVHNEAYRMVDERGIDDALVFYEGPIYGTWARQLRNPRPDLSDEVLYLRRHEFSFAELAAFAERRFPAREAWAYFHNPLGGSSLVPLEQMVQREKEGGLRLGAGRRLPAGRSRAGRRSPAPPRPTGGGSAERAGR